MHRQNTIYPKIPEIIAELTGIIGEAKVQELTTINPQLVVQNKRIDIRQPHKVELSVKEKISLYTEDAMNKFKNMLKK